MAETTDTTYEEVQQVGPESGENIHEEPWYLEDVVEYAELCLEQSAPVLMGYILQNFASMRGLTARIWTPSLTDDEIQHMTEEGTNKAFRRFFNGFRRHNETRFQISQENIYNSINEHLINSLLTICEWNYQNYAENNVNAVTNLPNGKVMEDFLFELIKTNTPFTYGFFDIDRLKIWNAALTEEVVDRILTELGIIINECIRTDENKTSFERLDQIGTANRRVLKDGNGTVSVIPDFKKTDVFSVHRSGDEYNIALPQTDYATALKVANRILAKINQHIFKIQLSKAEVEGVQANKDKYFERILNAVKPENRDEKKKKITEILIKMHEEEGITHSHPNYVNEVKARIFSVMYPDVKSMLSEIEQEVYETLVRLQRWNRIPGSSDEQKREDEHFIGMVSAEFWKRIGVQLEDDKIGALAYIINNLPEADEVGDVHEMNIHLSASMGLVDCGPSAFDAEWRNTVSNMDEDSLAETPYNELERRNIFSVISSLKTLGNIAEKYVKINGRGRAVAVRRDPNDQLTYCSMNDYEEIVEESTISMSNALAA